MLLVLLFSALVPLTMQQCLTSNDQLREVGSVSIDHLMNSEFEFSADLIRVVSSTQPGENMFFSPASVYRALLLTYFLAANDTEDSLRKTLRLDPKLDKLDYMGAYSLVNYYQKLLSVMNDGCQTSVANRLYVDKKIKVQHCIRILFNEELQTENFRRNSIGVRRKINQWVATQTNNTIKEFLDEDSISKNTRLVLVNAAYFKGIWKNKFDTKDTRKAIFRLSNGTEVKTQMMNQENRYKMVVDDTLDAEVLEMPYLGDTISMYILLPAKVSATALQEMLQRINVTTLHNMFAKLKSKDYLTEFYLSIPKFTMDETLQLIPILEKLGVGDLFQSTADLSRLTGSKGLTLSEAVHKAKIKVNEEGTEAAGATAFISARMGPPNFKANKPFAYLLFDNITKNILFFGVYNRPE